jgi:hypothetical protein
MVFLPGKTIQGETYILKLMKKFFCIFLFCFAALTSKCQFIDTLQSAIERNGSFSFCFNTRSSYISNYDANIFGYMVGVCFGKKFTIGGGINSLSSTIYQTSYVGGDTLKGKLNFFFFSYFVEYIITLSKHWRIDIPISIGIGNASLQYTENKQVTTQDNRTIIPLEPQVELDYNFNKYVGLYTQVGYRYMLVNNNLLSYNFNSVTYSVGVLIYPLEIYAGLFPRTKLAKMIED